MKRLSIPLRILLGCMAICAMSHSAQGQLIPFGKQKSNNANNYELTQSAGPWLIMVTSFTGEAGLQQARRLAQELREEHHLPAYIYTHEFNFEKELSHGLGWEVVRNADQKETIRPIQMKPLTKSQFEEIAVLVGDFPSVDDSKAQKTLEKIKTFTPATMQNFDVKDAVEGEDLAGGRLRAWRGFTNLVNTDSDSPQLGPLRAAFLLPNPLLPDEYFSARQVDQFVMNLNKDQKYSLLKNPGVYSVKVASFSGDTTLDINKMQQIEAEDTWRLRNRKGITDSKLVDAAKKATLLTYELRKKGFDAYEFHDRHESYVCVGGFEWLTQEDGNGGKRNNPDIETTILEFKGESIYVPGKPGATKTYPLPRQLTNNGIACDAQPLPVLIPKATETKTASRFFGLRR